jgi:integrase
VFLQPDGRSFDRSCVSKGEHQRALKAAGLRRTVRLHDLRHTAAAAWIAGGLPLVYVQQQLGHANIGTTERHYGHLAESYLGDACAKANVAVFGTSRAMAVT